MRMIISENLYFTNSVKENFYHGTIIALKYSSWISGTMKDNLILVELPGLRITLCWSKKSNYFFQRYVILVQKSNFFSEALQIDPRNRFIFQRYIILIQEIKCFFKRYIYLPKYRTIFQRYCVLMHKIKLFCRGILY